MNADQIQFLATMLVNLNDASANWQEIATQRAISRKDNAQTGFKSMVKKIGLDYNGKKFTFIEGFDSTKLAGTTPKKTTTPRKRKAEAESATSSPTKKRAPKQSKAVDEEEEDNAESDLKPVKTE